MQLLIKQRVFSWSDTYDVYDEAGNVKYFIKGEFLSVGHRLHVCDAMGNEIGLIKEKILAFMPEFEIEIDGAVCGRIQKKFSFFKPRYDVDFMGWRTEGDFLGWDYDVYSGCSSIMHISQQPLRWGDTYIIDFENPADEIAGLLLVIAIDAANCSEN